VRERQRRLVHRDRNRRDDGSDPARCGDAKRNGRAVTVRWRVAFDVGVVGLNVYREVIRSGRRDYRFVDRRAAARAPFRYWIRAVYADGSRSWLGATPAIR
jgi:hypothetical protein